LDSGVAVEIAESIRIGEGIFSLTKICYDGLGMLDWMSGSIIAGTVAAIIIVHSLPPLHTK